LEAVKVNFSKSAEASLNSIAFWFDQTNSKGSGLRFMRHFENRILILARSFPYYSPCGNIILKRLGFFCTNFRQWIIVFEVRRKSVYIRSIFHKNALPK
jgi:hypothetical protein